MKTASLFSPPAPPPEPPPLLFTSSLNFICATLAGMRTSRGGKTHARKGGGGHVARGRRSRRPGILNTAPSPPPKPRPTCQRPTRHPPPLFPLPGGVSDQEPRLARQTGDRRGSGPARLGRGGGGRDHLHRAVKIGGVLFASEAASPPPPQSLPEFFPGTINNLPPLPPTRAPSLPSAARQADSPARSSRPLLLGQSHTRTPFPRTETGASPTRAPLGRLGRTGEEERAAGAPGKGRPGRGEVFHSRSAARPSSLRCRCRRRLALP